MKEGSGKMVLALGGTVAGAAVIAAGIWIWGAGGFRDRL